VLSVAIDRRGDVVAAGGFSRVGATVLKFSGVTGLEQWRYTVPDIGQMNSVVLDAAGDVVAAGMQGTKPPDVVTSFLVAKLAGTDGAERWRKQLPPSGAVSPTDEAFTAAVDRLGNVVVGGRTTHSTPSGPHSAFTVVELDGATGATLWRHRIQGTAIGHEGCYAVVVDRSGNVVAAGRTVNRRTGNDFTVSKLEATTGRELWRRIVIGQPIQHGQANAVAVARNGDVFAAGSISDPGAKQDFVVVRLSGRTGTRRWRRIVSGRHLSPPVGSPHGGGRAAALALDADGDVVAAGALRNGRSESSTDLVVAKIARASGRVRWVRAINGTGTGEARARAVAVLPNGDVAAAGAVENIGSFFDFAVVRLAGIDGRATMP
jgi:outer membrane protein assembly factor BamB